jgi:hypothetical protein
MALSQRARKARHKMRHSKTPVGFDGVPVSPIVHHVLQDVREHSRRHFTLISADRRNLPAVRKFGHAIQADLWKAWVNHEPGANPANPPGTSTHEYRNGGTNQGVTGSIAYHTLFAFGATLPPWGLGLDFASPADAEVFIEEAKRHGYPAFLPYPGTSEAHHVNLEHSPLNRLIERGRVP